MSLDLGMFADKLRRYCTQLEVSTSELADGTGMPIERLEILMDQKAEPSGDEILILADFFKCDYNFFISNQKFAPFEQTESLFRKHSAVLNKNDRWAIQEFLFLCECEEFLLSNMPERRRQSFVSAPLERGYYKGHGERAAKDLRLHLGYDEKQIPRDVFSDFRSIGIHLFRRRLEQSSISGLFVRHPVAGPCVLVNYSEDVFRQRFTAAHEAGHALLDEGEEFVVSFTKWEKGDLSETRANTFASRFLLPPETLRSIVVSSGWSVEEATEWAIRLMVNTETLAISLKEAKLVGDADFDRIKGATVGRRMKSDPELPDSLPPRVRERKEQLLVRGLSDFYVNLSFEAYEKEIVSAGRLAEMLLVYDSELSEIAKLYNRRLVHGD